MPWPVSANPDRFDEAMEWFEKRVPIAEKDLEKLSKEAQKQAFTIAGVNQMSVVMTVFDEMQKAVEQGEPIQEFRKRVKAKLRGQWTKATSARLDTIFITSTQTAYNSGRFKQLSDPDVVKTRPFWVFDAVMDDRTTHICQTLNGLTLPANAAEWANNYPPMHHRCRSGVRSERRSTVTRRGGPTKKGDIPNPKVPRGFGKTPEQAQFKPRKQDYPADVWAEYQNKQRQLRKG